MTIKASIEIDPSNASGRAKKIFSPDHFVALGAAATAVMMVAPWVSVPLGNAIGLDLSYSVPDLLGMATTLSDYVHSASQLVEQVQSFLATLARIVETGGNLADLLGSIGGSL